MILKDELLHVLNNEPRNQFEVSVESLNYAGIDWVEISELASRDAYIKKKLTESSDGGLAFRDDQVVFLRKGKEG